MLWCEHTLPDLPAHSVTTVSTMSCCIPWSQERLAKLQAFKKRKIPSKPYQQTECARPALCRHRNHIYSLQNEMGAGTETPLVPERDQNQLPWFQKSLLSLFRTPGMWFCSSYVTGTMFSEATCALGPYSSKSRAVAWQGETQKGGEKN